jgi:glycosyltransferase involved in cell wall biosynthesis
MMQTKLPKVLMVLPDYPFPVVGGLERQAHELCKALLKHGVEVSVISTVFSPEHKRYELVDGVGVTRICFNKNSKYRFLKSSLLLLLELIKNKKNYDVIHLHQHSWFALYTIILAKILGKPTILKLANVGKHGIPGLVDGTFGGLKKIILCRSDAIIAMSKQSLYELDAISYPANQVLVTPNGIPVQSSISGLHLKTRKRDDEICKVVFVGRLMPQKGLEDLLYAWKKLITKISKGMAQLEILGAGPIQAQLEMLALKLEIEETVFFRGYVSDVPQCLLKMDIFVLPSHSEGNSNAILEAMRASLPVISTKVGGTSMQVGIEGADFLVLPGDVERLAEKLFLLVNEPDLRKNIGRKMHERVVKHFNMDTVALTYTQAYKLLHSGNRQICSVSNSVVLESD